LPTTNEFDYLARHNHAELCNGGEGSDAKKTVLQIPSDKEIIREHIPDAVLFYPLGMPDVTNPMKPITLGIRSPNRSFLAIWRIDGDAEVHFPLAASAEILYPKDLGIVIHASGDECILTFPRPRMGCILASSTKPVRAGDR
jgi:hypothetical protein